MESRRKNKIIVILGPTSSGKSAVAIKLAKKFNGEIISADSRQVYRGMNIGTGKITRTERKMAKHHLIDIVSPKVEYNVSQFKKDADRITADILQRGKVPIICGGTGFWIKSVVDNVVFPEVKPNKGLRNSLLKKTAAELFRMLKKLDPERAKNIDRNNPVRLIRAIEICKAIGKVPKINKAPKYNSLQIGLAVPKEKLHQNIRRRLKKRWKNGMIKEVENLKKSGLNWKKIQSFGLAYFWIPLYMQNKISKQELIEKVYSAEKDYAKRQITWFQKDKRIKWLKSYKGIKKSVSPFIEKR